jgi:FKBP-type peptidyl-prolyl cis-trans isomerase SlyD
MSDSKVKAAKNHVVSIDYTLTDKDGKVLDSSQGREALEYLHGHGNIISGLEKALEGKVPGDEFTVTVPAKEAYGEYDENLVADVDRKNFPKDAEIEEGMQFQAESASGPMIVTVKKVNKDKVTIDGNHELAGLDLTFKVNIKTVRKATDKEIEKGHLGCGCGEDCGCNEGGCGCGDEGCGCGDCK